MIGFIKKLIATTLVFVLVLAHSTQLLAQSSPDTRSPVIELEAVAESAADNSQVFTAQVVDDRNLKDVLLYYRRDGQQAFIPTPMTPIGDSAFFTASVETDPDDLRAIQYYVQARDEGGNRTVEGYAFDPYTRVLIANDTVISAPESIATQTTTTSSTNGKIRWWHVALGVVLVGAVAAAASGGGGNDSAEEGTVPLTVNITGL